MSAHIRWGGEHLRGEEYRVVPGCGRGLRRGVGGGLAGDVEAVGTAIRRITGEPGPSRGSARLGGVSPGSNRGARSGTAGR